MTSKLPYSDPLPDDRFARRLIGEINRTVGVYITEHDNAVESNDERLLRQANQTRTLFEDAVNGLRSMTEISDSMKIRVTDALTRADDVLARYDPIDLEIRSVESPGGQNEVNNASLPHPSPPPLRRSVENEDISALLFPGTGRLSRQSSHHSSVHLLNTQCLTIHYRGQATVSGHLFTKHVPSFSDTISPFGNRRISYRQI